MNIFSKLFTCLLFLTLSFSPLHGQKKDSLEIMIGQMIMGGVRDFYDTGIKQELLADIKAGRLGGIILFEKNLLPVDSKKELASLILECQKNSNTPLLVSIDEEGGRVNRLKPKYGFHKPPSAESLGKINNLDTTRYYSGLTAKALYDLGINVNFAPNVDVNINPDNPVIGKIGRSFSLDYQTVAAHAAAYISGHDEYNIATAIKHFPGHGSSKDDTHLGVADVSETWVIEEIYPYKMLIDSNVVKAVMTSHVVNRSLDESKLPGTLSNKIVNGVLRGLLGFDGVVFTDDMQMKAIADNYGLEKSIELAINGGVDVLVFANNVPNHDVVTVREVFDMINQMVSEGQITKQRITESYQRITALKGQLGLLEPNYSRKLQKRLKDLN